MSADQPIPIPTAVNVTELARRHGVTRQTIWRRLKRGWVPPAVAPRRKRKTAARVTSSATPQSADATPAAVSNATPAPSVDVTSNATLDAAPRNTQTVARTPFLAGTVALLGVALAAIGLTVNARYAASLGRTPAKAYLLAALGFVVDGCAIVLLSVACMLWRAAHQAAAMAAFALWIAATAYTVIATGGFVSMSINDTFAARAGAIEQAANLRAQRDRAVAAAQAAVSRAAADKAAECDIVGPHCRQRIADLEAAEAALNSAIAMPVTSPPAISAPDPGARMIAEMLHLNEHSVAQVRIAGLTLAPATAGLLLSFAVLLW